MSFDVEPSSHFGTQLEDFERLMEHRIQTILVVASRYDAFVLEEGGQLTELIVQEYRDLHLNLRYIPEIIRVTEVKKGLELLEEREFDMVVATPRLTDMEVEDFVHQVRETHPMLPITVLAAHAWDLPKLEHLRSSGDIDLLFLWYGDVKALLAMIKHLEDLNNAKRDVLELGVQVIILVEDEVRFYSLYLPHFYTEITLQTSLLMSEGLNISHRLLRMRARPKIMLAQSFEEALQLYERYAPNVLGIISDVSYPRGGAMDPEAGLELARRVREVDPDLPILLQSTQRDHKASAEAIGTAFVHKRSPNMLEELRQFIVEQFGFGDFVFRNGDGRPVAKASDMREMVKILAEVPAESVIFHAQRNHFSAWLKARTEFELASRLRPRSVAEFGSAEELRRFLIASLNSYLRGMQRHVIADFDGATYDDFVTFAKIGSGSLGGKGRGLAFFQKLLASGRLAVPGVEMAIPQTVVVATDVFDEFLEQNSLRKLPRRADTMSDDEILRAFRKGRFLHDRRTDLADLLESVREPLAVRSSSLLEDSLYQPFAGVYATVMVPNSHPSLDVRLAQLLEAIKLVFASTFLRNARDYLRSTPHRIEEERMAVLIQRLVGSRRGDLFYPSMAGVASSYNFYPFGNMKPEDGVVQIAVGLGKSVVEGHEALRFCPSQPQVLPQLSSIKDVLRNAQRRFWALDMAQEDVIAGIPLDSNLSHRETHEAVQAGAADLITSTYLRANDTLISGVVDGGAPIITFAPMLRGRLFPLPEILSRMLAEVRDGMACPVEAEFAMDMQRGRDEPPVFHVLQIRPMVVEKIGNDMTIDSQLASDAVVYSETALGHGRGTSLTDLVIVRPQGFDRSTTARVASVIERINRTLSEEGRNYILVGPGRWGSQDPWLGIPVSWSQISGARAIVETDFADLEVEPSQGSHFFHNITCFGIAYLSVHEARGSGHINWSWLASLPRLSEEIDGFVFHARAKLPTQVIVDGENGRGVILPGTLDAP